MTLEWQWKNDMSYTKIMQTKLVKTKNWANIDRNAYKRWKCEFYKEWVSVSNWLTSDECVDLMETMLLILWGAPGATVMSTRSDSEEHPERQWGAPGATVRSTRRDSEEHPERQWGAPGATVGAPGGTVRSTRRDSEECPEGQWGAPGATVRSTRRDSDEHPERQWGVPERQWHRQSEVSGSTDW